MQVVQETVTETVRITDWKTIRSLMDVGAVVMTTAQLPNGEVVAILHVPACYHGNLSERH